MKIIFCHKLSGRSIQVLYDLILTKNPLHPLDGILLIWKGQDQHQLSAINTISNNRRYMNSHILPPSIQLPSPTHVLHAKVFFELHKLVPCDESSTQLFQNKYFDVHTFCSN